MSTANLHVSAVRVGDWRSYKTDFYVSMMTMQNEFRAPTEPNISVPRNQLLWTFRNQIEMDDVCVEVKDKNGVYYRVSMS